MVGAHGPIGSIGTGDTEPKPTEILNLNDEEKMWIKLDGPNQMNGLYGIGRAIVDNDIFIFGRFQRCSKFTKNRKNLVVWWWLWWWVERSKCHYSS